MVADERSDSRSAGQFRSWLKPQNQSDSYIDLRPAEWEVLALIDGRHSLRDIAAELAVSEFEVAKRYTDF